VRRLNVLISGAGIAGCTLAYWLARYGHAATVVERGGALVDVRGPDWPSCIWIEGPPALRL
jgi:2-polyprenyl-6-methoxyphenol hydroxylase-like FAD-dependent oxidoreductase